MFTSTFFTPISTNPVDLPLWESKFGNITKKTNEAWKNRFYEQLFYALLFSSIFFSLYSYKLDRHFMSARKTQISKLVWLRHHTNNIAMKISDHITHSEQSDLDQLTGQHLEFFC